MNAASPPRVVSLIAIVFEILHPEAVASGHRGTAVVRHRTPTA